MSTGLRATDVRLHGRAFPHKVFYALLIFQILVWSQVAAQAPDTCPDAATKGCWGDSTIQFTAEPNLAPVHGLLLSTGNLMSISHATVKRYQIFHPTDLSVDPDKPIGTSDDLYCAGHVTLFDGKSYFFSIGDGKKGYRITKGDAKILSRGKGKVLRLRDITNESSKTGISDMEDEIRKLEKQIKALGRKLKSLHKQKMLL